MSTKRKTGPSEAALRLERMAKSARPASEHVHAGRDERLGETGAAASLSDPAILNVSLTVAPPDTSHVSSNAAGFVTDDTPSPVTSHVTEESADGSMAAENIVAPPGGHAPPAVNDDHRGGASARPQQQFTARLRGRWTKEQKAFINRLGKDQRATAGEILRHIAAWFLERRSVATPKPTTPSGQTLIKRETGLLILDFLTTPEQASQIKAASVGLGEAAWLRLAVEAYRNQGPLARH